MKWITPFTLTFAVLSLLVAGWLLYVSYLTRAGNRSCQVSMSVNQSDEISPISLEIQDVINDYSIQEGGVGLQVTVIFHDGVLWNGTAGYADIRDQCPLTLEHHLYIGSMTKLFTTALVMGQVEQGNLTLDDPLSAWVRIPNADGVTIRNLLNHTSGLPDYARDAWFQIRWFGFPRKTWLPDELARVIQDKPVRFAPGLRHEYSNSNYLLLGMILEKATRKPFSRKLDETILGKLELHNTYFLTYPDDVLIANGYDESLLHLGRRDLTGFRRSMESGAYAAGGMLSTSQDVARFVHALFNRQILSDASLAEMKTFIDAPDTDIPEQVGYGLGTRRLVIDSDVFLGHSGSIPGYSGIAMFNEQKSYTIAILGNLSTIKQTRLLAKIHLTIQKDRSHSSTPGGKGG